MDYATRLEDERLIGRKEGKIEGRIEERKEGGTKYHY